MLPLIITTFALLLYAMWLAATLQCRSPPLPGLDKPGPTALHEDRIAIIGAGIGGASAAFHIQEFNRNRRSQKVTIFERESNVGGRVKSTYLYPSTGGLQVIEEGATHFFTDDWCLLSTMENVGLKPTKPSSRPLSWWRNRRSQDEGRTDIKCNAESTAWQDNWYRRWKYGRSWKSFHSAVQSFLEGWNEFGSPYHPPFTSIAKELSDVGIPDSVSGSASAFFRNLTVSPPLETKFVQPCARGRISRNLADSSRLAALIASGKSTKTSVNVGNSRLIERMVRLSDADLRLNSFVTAISSGQSRRYRLSISNLTSNHSSKVDDAEFDMMILAAPLLSGKIDLGGLRKRSTLMATPGMETHVTHFSSSTTVSSDFSILPLDISILGENTLTTSTVADSPNILNLQRSSACFRSGCMPGDECDQCDEDTILYRVHSDRYLEDWHLVRMLGQDFQNGTELIDYGIGYVRRQKWPNSFPKVSEGSVNFVDEVEIAPKLYYLNGAESVVCSMEMSCRVGRNVAQMVTW